LECRSQCKEVSREEGGMPREGGEAKFSASWESVLTLPACKKGGKSYKRGEKGYVMHARRPGLLFGGKKARILLQKGKGG